MPEYIPNKKVHGLMMVFTGAGITLQEISDACGISKTTLAQFLAPGAIQMRPGNYEKLVKYFTHLKDTNQDFRDHVDQLLGKTKKDDSQDKPVQEAAAVKPAPDLVNHPNHYLQAAVTVEPIDLTQHLPHPLASAFEYLVRAGHKDGQSEALDLQKARFWLRRWLQLDASYVPMNMDSFAALVVLRKKNPLACGMLLPAAEEALRQHEEGFEVFPFPINTKTINTAVEDTIDRITNRLIELGVETKEAS